MNQDESNNETPDVSAPPRTLGATLRRLGPGMIIAGSIVGSGELIATTKTGAEAGFWLLWLILIGCVIKVFTQVEFGRYTITWSQTPLKALDGVPGPRWRVNWVLWYWAIMTVLVISQQGGIVGGIGQALTISRPVTEHGSRYNALQDRFVDERVELARLYKRHPDLLAAGITLSRLSNLREKAEKGDEDAAAELADLKAKRAALVADTDAAAFARREKRMLELRGQIEQHGEPSDPYLWAALLAVATSVLLYVGRYGLIQAVATVLVATFSAVTILTLILLQAKPDWAVSGREVLNGMSFRLPPAAQSLTDNPLATALGAFGIIGVGAAELIMYPYWCLEKGYAKYTGLRDGSRQWLERARGWMRVLQTDAWLSMVVYTFATVAFYMLGAAVLGRAGMNPEKGEMIRTLAEMYVPVFGTWAPAVFLVGAVAVLYSTFFVAAAGNARMLADALGLFGLTDGTEAARMRWTRILSAIWPLVALVVFVFVRAPAAMVLASGIAQAIMLPMLGVAALYFRYRRSDPNLRSGTLWDAMLWLSFVGFLIAGTWSLYSTIMG